MDTFKALPPTETGASICMHALSERREEGWKCEMEEFPTQHLGSGATLGSRFTEIRRHKLVLGIRRKTPTSDI